VFRGCVYDPAVRSVAARVEVEFGFAETPVVSFADLNAGEIVAALDRQHLRDWFEVRDLLAHEGIQDFRFLREISIGRSLPQPCDVLGPLDFRSDLRRLGSATCECRLLKRLRWRCPT
jgi:Nucleotidyl transferase AbiEii toxin, Type IV TA system